MATSDYDFSGGAGSVAGIFVLSSETGVTHQIQQNGSGAGCVPPYASELVQSRDTTVVTANQRAQIVINPAGLPNWAMRINLRMTAAGNGYRGVFNAFGNVFSFYRVDAWVETSIRADIAGSITDGDIFGAGMDGSTLTIYKNGAVVGTVVDATYSATGFAELGLFASNNITFDSWHLEDSPVANEQQRLTSQTVHAMSVGLRR